jgi:hypothetical protein
VNVEHRVPHKGDLGLKYDWNNLFLSCTHCNNTKLGKYDDIIDPTSTDPEDCMRFTMDGLRKNVTITKIDGGEDVDITIGLLDCVYNGTTDMKRFEANVLRGKIRDELARFRAQIKLYNSEPTEELRAYINGQIAKASLFAAFKRSIVRGAPVLENDFSEALA